MYILRNFKQFPLAKGPLQYGHQQRTAANFKLLKQVNVEPRGCVYCQRRSVVAS